MSQVSRELAAEGLTRAEIELRHGSLTVRTASPGEPGLIESDGPLEVSDAGEVLFVRQPQFTRGDVDLILPATVQELRCQTGRGDITVSSGHGRLAAKAGDGDVRVSGWQGPMDLASGRGDVEVEDAQDDLKATTGEGDISIDRAWARVEARTGKGDISVSDISGEAILNTGQGDVEGEDLAGARIDAHTGQGDVELEGMLAGLRVGSGQGDVTCRCSLGEGNHEIKTSQGDIDLGLPQGAQLRIDAATSHGHVETDLPLVKVGTSGPQGYFSRRLVGSIGSDESRPTVTLRTNHGDIRIFAVEGLEVESEPTSGAQNTGDEAQPQTSAAWDQPAIGPNGPSSEVEPASSADERMAILEALSRGEISIDEALVLIGEGRPKGDVTGEARSE